MSTGWIKVRRDLVSHPHFFRLCRLSGRSQAEALLTLLKLAEWFGTHAEYSLLNATPDVVDWYLEAPGFADALITVGWLKVCGDKVSVRGFMVPAAMRKVIGTKLRADVLSAGACAACGGTEELQVEHDIPVARGGSCDRKNLQCLCGPCNRAKRLMTMAEFVVSRRGTVQ